jgi:hypothetical protein
VENIIYTLHCAIHFISIAEIHGEQFDGKPAQPGRAAGVTNNAADLHVFLLDQLFNQSAADKSGRASNKYRAPGIQSRKRFIWVGRGSGATSAQGRVSGMLPPRMDAMFSERLRVIAI